MKINRLLLQLWLFLATALTLGFFSSVVVSASPPHYFGGVPDVSASEISGVRLSEVRPDSPAQKAGLQPGDIIVKLGQVTIKNVDDLLFALRSTLPGAPLKRRSIFGKARNIAPKQGWCRGVKPVNQVLNYSVSEGINHIMFSNLLCKEEV